MEHYVLIQQTHLFVYAAVLLVQPEKHHWIIATLVPVKMEILALIGSGHSFACNCLSSLLE